MYAICTLFTYYTHAPNLAPKSNLRARGSCLEMTSVFIAVFQTHKFKLEFDSKLNILTLKAVFLSHLQSLLCDFSI